MKTEEQTLSRELSAPSPPLPETSAETLGKYLVNDSRARLFLVSLVTLFLELVCIRWLPSYIRYLSYFSNFILLGAFLGIGVGSLAASTKRSFLHLFPLALVSLIIITALTKFQLVITSTDVLYYQQSIPKGYGVESYWILPLIVCWVALLFVILGLEIGKLLKTRPPLEAYTVNILGSLAGIALFSLLAFFFAPPTVWFAVVGFCMILLLPLRKMWLHTFVLGVAIGLVFYLAHGSYWSPYYRVTMTPLEGAPGSYAINVNNIGHQIMTKHENKEPFYFVPYRVFQQPKFKDVLIIGAGSGSDTAIALANDVKNVDAVEIDPLIVKLGSLYNPDKPYQDARVKVHIDDGRAFLRRTNKKYDLIIYALPDSLTLTSSFANLRLESFLFTEESFRSAREHLKENGLFVLYNYYREEWLIHKIGTMLYHSFGEWPQVVTYGGSGRAAVLMAGPRTHEYQSKTLPLEPGEETFSSMTPYEGPTGTDNWPFLYLKTKRVSSLYVKSLALVIGLALAFLGIFGPRGALRRMDWHFFFLGAAFMLLEVKSIVGFSLLFGSTWMVNSLVFFAILVMVLLAIRINSLIRIRQTWILYGLLFASLAAAYLIPSQALLFDQVWMRYVVASLLGFAPIFWANLIFTHSFRNTEEADFAYGSNLLGALVGGTFEYLSLVVGYQNLILFVIAFYALAMLSRKRQAV